MMVSAGNVTRKNGFHLWPLDGNPLAADAQLLTHTLTPSIEHHTQHHTGHQSATLCFDGPLSSSATAMHQTSLQARQARRQTPMVMDRNPPKATDIQLTFWGRPSEFARLGEGWATFLPSFQSPEIVGLFCIASVIDLSVQEGVFLSRGRRERPKLGGNLGSNGGKWSC